MDKLVICKTITDQWKTLIEQASHYCSIKLKGDIESYLVFLLMRFTKSTELSTNIIALELLETFNQSGSRKNSNLRDIGDKCLLLSGLFPGFAKHRRVRVSYFIKLGKIAYSSICDQTNKNLSKLFTQLGENFVPMMDVLHSIREVDQQILTLDPMQAEEIWNDTGSTHAFKTLCKFTKTKPIISLNSLSKLRH